LTSAATFAIGALLPLLVVFLLPTAQLLVGVAVMSLVFLALLGGIAAKVGGASVLAGVWRVTFWGALAMLATAGVGSLFGVTTA
jgi:VIT1/CCC1 family predicted Fe2+/Mn2+ transporter